MGEYLRDMLMILRGYSTTNMASIVLYYSDIPPQTRDDEVNLSLETRSHSRPKG
jgi:hypothetical protein